MKRILILINSTIFTLLFYSYSFAQTEEKTKWDIQTCINYAVTHNITVNQTSLSQQSSEVTYKQSQYNRLPSISGNVSQTFSNPNNSSTSLGIQSDVILFNGNKISNTIEKNKIITEQKSIEIEEAKNNIILAVAESYIQCLYFKENIVIEEKKVIASKKELELSKAKFEAGSIAIKDLSDIESQLANNEYAVIKAKNNYSQQILSLKQLLELKPNTEFEISAPTFDIETLIIPDVNTVFESACNRMPEIQRAKQQATIDSLQIKIAKATYFPYLSLSAGVGTNIYENNNINIYNQFNDNYYNSLRVQLTIPIFNNYETKSNVQIAQINSKINLLQTESTKKDLYQKIEQAINNATSYQSELYALQKVENSALKSYELATEQFKFGVINPTDLYISETNYSNAVLSKMQAKYMTFLYYQLLQFYQGNPISF